MRSPLACPSRFANAIESPGPAPFRAGRFLLPAWRIILLLALLLPCCEASDPSRPALIPPRIPREFRGLWVATVGNIDWPSRPGLPTAEQKSEMIDILDFAARMNFNAIILQVRPACDALYDSPIEPWSYYLTGQMGKPPAPHYDPLAFAVAEAHRRGLELHAWFNPFRARTTQDTRNVASNHVIRASPSLVRPAGKLLMLDPGAKAARDHTAAVILDVVRRYDIDGVHMDDYFYPYPDPNFPGDFPDQNSWNKYRQSGGRLSRDDWRRKNIDDFVQQTYAMVKTAKPWVKFGISPFGIWRPGHPPKVTGLDAYAAIYADSRKWLSQGWVDYLSPQLYWPIKPPAQSYPALLQWWSEQNPRGRHLWPGNNFTRAASLYTTPRERWAAREIADQVALTRRQSGASGNIMWNTSSVMDKGSLGPLTYLKNAYAHPALVPGLPWQTNTAPEKPYLQFRTNTHEVRLSWSVPTGPPARLWVVQTLAHGAWSMRVHEAASPALAWRLRKQMPEAIAVTAVNHFGSLGPTALFVPE